MNRIYAIRLIRVEDGKADALITAWKTEYPDVIQKMFDAGIELSVDDAGVISASIANGSYAREQLTAFFDFLSTKGVLNQFEIHNISILVLAEQIEIGQALSETICGKALFSFAKELNENVSQMEYGLELDMKTSNVYVIHVEQAEDVVSLCLFPKGSLTIENLLLTVKKLFSLLV